MKKSPWIFVVLTIFLATLRIYGEDDCEKRKCIKNIEEALDATYVLIDPGHGGTEPQAVFVDKDTQEKTEEKDLNLKISKALKNRLIQLGIKNVDLTRNKDENLEEDERVERIIELFARAKKNFQRECEEFYPIFISIHQNSHWNQNAHGTEQRLGYWHGENGFLNSLPWMVDDQLRVYFDAHQGEWCWPGEFLFRDAIIPLRDGTKVEGEDVKMNIQHTLAEIGFISNSDDRQKLRTTNKI